MAVDRAVLLSRIELDLAGRVPAPFTYRDRKTVETVSAGIPEIDALTGGLPRGSLTEVYGPACSGRTSLLVSILASQTSHSEACALVDGHDSFDPHSAKAAGVELDQLLWVRCGNIDQALRATDLLLRGGGFGLIAIDLSDIPPKTVRCVPLNAWFRFRRAVENTPTILVLLAQESNAKTCASLVLQLGAKSSRWSKVNKTNANVVTHPSACLLDEFAIHAEVVHSRVQPVNKLPFQNRVIPFHASDVKESPGTFKTKPMWSYSGEMPPGLKTRSKTK